MRDTRLRSKGIFGSAINGFVAIAFFCGAAGAAAENHGLAMHGEPALPSDFSHFPYVNPAAPKGGSITFGVVGGFDSLNPYALRGRAPWEVQAYTVESLMTRSWDEPFTLYAGLASRVRTPPDRSWVEFTLDPDARFSDGSPVTAEDVLWSFEERGVKGSPGFRNVWAKVATAEATDGVLRFTFDAPDREAPLILGLAPVLKKIEGLALAEPTLTPLVASGPYVVDAFEPGRSLSLRRNPDWWAADKPQNVGRHNLDEIRVEWFRDASAHIDAFRAGAIDVFREGDPARWALEYDFARISDGRANRVEIPHGRPSGMYGLVFNTRRAPFDDIRVRRALSLAFNFEFVNAAFFDGAYRRIGAYFDNSGLRHTGPAEGAERAILEPFADLLPEGALDAAWTPPNGDPDDPRNRRNLRAAARMLEEAGWTARDGALRDANGAPMRFEILLGLASDERVVGVFADALRGLGVDVVVRTVDAAQYQERRNDYDYDMTMNRWVLSLSPGNEQRFYFGSDGVKTPGTRNYMGVDSPAVDAAIEAMLTTDDVEIYRAATRALDRALSHGDYVIPFWHDPISRLAYDSGLKWSDDLPLYGDWIGWAPDVWWRE